MKLLVLICLLFATVGVPAAESDSVRQAREELTQTKQLHGPQAPEIVSKLNRLADLLAEEGAFEESYSLLCEIRRIQEAAHGLMSLQTAEAIDRIAAIMPQMKLPDNAPRLRREALTIREKLWGPLDRRVFEETLGIAESAAAHDYQLSRDLYLHALEARQRSLSPDHPDAALCFSRLEKLMMRPEYNHELLELYQRETAIREQAFGPDSLKLAPVLRKFASAHGDTYTERLKAKPQALRAMKICLNAHGPAHPEFAECLDVLGDCTHGGNALDLYRWSLNIREKTTGPDSPEVSQSLKRIVGWTLAQGRTNGTEELLRRILKISEKTSGPESLETASALSDLADLLCHHQKHLESRRLYERAAAICEKSNAASAERLAASLEKLGIELCLEGKYDDAETVCRRVLKLQEQASSRHSFEAVILGQNRLAEICILNGRFDEAEALYRQTLKRGETQRGNHSNHLDDTLDGLARLWIDTGRFQEAVPALRRLTTIQSAARYGRNANPETLLDLAMLLLATHQESDVIVQEMIDKADQSEAPNRGVPHCGISGSSPIHFGDALQRRLSLQEKELRLRRGLAAREKAYGEDHPLVAIQLNHLADHLLGIDWFSPSGISDARRRKEAEPLYQRSLTIMRKNGQNALLTRLLAQNANPGTRGRHLTPPFLSAPVDPDLIIIQPPSVLPLSPGSFIRMPDLLFPVFRPAPGYSLPRKL